MLSVSSRAELGPYLHGVDGALRDGSSQRPSHQPLRDAQRLLVTPDQTLDLEKNRYSKNCAHFVSPPAIRPPQNRQSLQHKLLKIEWNVQTRDYWMKVQTREAIQGPSGSIELHSVDQWGLFQWCLLVRPLAENSGRMGSLLIISPNSSSLTL